MSSTSTIATNAIPAETSRGIRLDLQEILQSLSNKIRAESAGSVADVRRRARLAEVGATKSLCSLCARFLTGVQYDDGVTFFSPGQIRDALDSAIIDARDLKILREEAEATLESLTQDPATSKLDPRSQILIAQLAEQETKLFEKVQELENTDADSSIQALKTCVTDMSRVLLDALCAARDANSDNQRMTLANDALSKIEGAAGAWATWFAAAERRACNRSFPELTLARELSAAMVGDAHLKAFVVALRHAMKLRRRHTRMSAALRRLQAAVGACDAITSLSGSVAEPW